MEKGGGSKWVCKGKVREGERQGRGKAWVRGKVYGRGKGRKGKWKVGDGKGRHGRVEKRKVKVAKGNQRKVGKYRNEGKGNAENGRAGTLFFYISKFSQKSHSFLTTIKPKILIKSS